ncbi:MAG: tRNA lysidine(34) synthetase TilS [Lysobacterales bacterium]
MNEAEKPFEPKRLVPALLGLNTDCTWWIAFSGGADSTALLHALAVLREKIPANLHALHIDHAIHPESHEWSIHCQALCREMDIPLHVERVKVQRDTGEGLEAEARRLRYLAAEKLMRPGDLLLTAHQADDQAETVILNLMRGSGVDGLSGMPTSRPVGKGTLVRLLLEFTGASLRAYLRSRNVPWIEDYSNQDLDYDRNFVRHALLPQLEQRWPGARRNLTCSAGHCREAREFISFSCDQFLHSARLAPGCLDLATLQESMNEAGSFRGLGLLLRQWLRLEEASNIPRARLREFLRQLRCSGQDGHLKTAWDGWVLQRYRNTLWLQRQDTIHPCPQIVWTSNQVIDLGAGLGRLSLEGPSPLPEWDLRVSARHGGEKIASLERGRHQSVKQVFQNRKIPPWLRPSIPVIWLDHRVVAVAGLALASDFRDELRKRNLRLCWKPDDPALKTAFEYLESGEG